MKWNIDAFVLTVDSRYDMIRCYGNIYQDAASTRKA